MVAGALNETHTNQSISSNFEFKELLSDRSSSDCILNKTLTSMFVIAKKSCHKNKFPNFVRYFYINYINILIVDITLTIVFGVSYYTVMSNLYILKVNKLTLRHLIGEPKIKL